MAFRNVTLESVLDTFAEVCVCVEQVQVIGGARWGCRNSPGEL